MGRVSTHNRRLLGCMFLPILFLYSTKPSHFVLKLPILFLYSEKPSHFVHKPSHFVPFVSHFVPFLFNKTMIINCFRTLYYFLNTFILENRLPTTSGEPMKKEKAEREKRSAGGHEPGRRLSPRSCPGGVHRKRRCI